MFWLILIIIAVLFLASDSGKIITAIAVISLAVFLIAKLTGFSMLEQIPKWGLVAIIVIIAGVILSLLFGDW